MPKLIEHLRESILACARAELLERGYNALAIRGVARDCGIAVGTVYNYFPSKDMLVGAVILEDWLVALEEMRRACAAAESLEHALSGMYRAIAAFSDTYRPVWAGYTFTDSAKSAYGERHNLLVEQLAACLRPVLARRAGEDPEGIDVFLAENVLVCTGNSLMTFDDFLHIVRRILP